jgi:hypothetical protein
MKPGFSPQHCQKIYMERIHITWNHFKVYNSVVFDMITVLYNHHHCLNSHHKPISNLSPFSPPTTTTKLYSVPVDVPILNISCTPYVAFRFSCCHFRFWWYWGLNSALCTCWASTLPHESFSQSNTWHFVSDFFYLVLSRFIHVVYL